MNPRFHAALAAILLAGLPSTSMIAETTSLAPRWAIALHGGAGTMRRDSPEELKQQYREALAEALSLGASMLEDGATSLDAVEAVVRALEDSPLFNAGCGAAVNRVGSHELDAAIMDGATLDNGAVGAVKGVRNPVTLARHVMEGTPHSLMVGEGALAVAREAGHPLEPDEYFRTEMRHSRWLELQKREAASTEAGDIERGTVGAVALDVHGNLAAATSTGGLTNKLPGRVGDTPIVGAGNYANNKTCAVSCTGSGEVFMRHVAAHRVSSMMEHGGATLQEAMESLFDDVLPRATGGTVAVDRDGNIVMHRNSSGMYRGAADSTGLFGVGFWDDWQAAE